MTNKTKNSTLAFDNMAEQLTFEQPPTMRQYWEDPRYNKQMIVTTRRGRAIYKNLLAKEVSGLLRDAKTRARFSVFASTGHRPSEIGRAQLRPDALPRVCGAEPVDGGAGAVDLARSYVVLHRLREVLLDCIMAEGLRSDRTGIKVGMFIIT